MREYGVRVNVVLELRCSAQHSITEPTNYVKGNE